MSRQLLTISVIILLSAGCASEPSMRNYSSQTLPRCEQSVVVTRIDSRWDESTGELSRTIEPAPPQCVQPSEWQPRHYSFAEELATEIVVGFVRGMVEVFVRAALNAH